MFMKIFGVGREEVFFVARGLANVEGDDTVMQLSVANRQKIDHGWLRAGGLGRNTHPFTGSETAGAAEGDGRTEQKLNVHIAAVSDLPDLAAPGKG